MSAVHGDSTEQVAININGQVYAPTAKTGQSQ